MSRPSNDITPPDLARATVEIFVREGITIRPPANPAGVLAKRCGVFVTLRTASGCLRGCIGTTMPNRDTVAEEIIQNAISAASRDPRFDPVTMNELAELIYGVDTLAPAEPANGIEDLDPALYGVIVEAIQGGKRGLLLPRIEGIETSEEQWRAVHLKAGIPLGTPVRVERFTVTRYGKD